MIKCARIICRHNKAGICKKGEPIVLDDQGECILAPDQGRDPLPDPPWIIDCLIELRKVSGYPFDYDKDRALLLDLRLDCPGVDLIEAVKDWRIWLIDYSSKRPINYRLRLRRWCTIRQSWRSKKDRWRTPDLQQSALQEAVKTTGVMAPRGCTACLRCGKETKEHELKLHNRTEIFHFYTCHCWDPHHEGKDEPDGKDEKNS